MLCSHTLLSVDVALLLAQASVGAALMITPLVLTPPMVHCGQVRAKHMAAAPETTISPYLPLEICMLSQHCMLL